jgi:hypothetical protein
MRARRQAALPETHARFRSAASAVWPMRSSLSGPAGAVRRLRRRPVGEDPVAPLRRGVPSRLGGSGPPSRGWVSKTAAYWNSGCGAGLFITMMLEAVAAQSAVTDIRRRPDLGPRSFRLISDGRRLPSLSFWETGSVLLGPKSSWPVTHANSERREERHPSLAGTPRCKVRP